MFTITNEPPIVTEARKKILDAFSDLTFQEEGHIYTLNGKQINTTVSGVGHQFIREPFDEAMQSSRYASKHGKTAEYWLQQWHQNSFRATTLGTKTHEFGESLGYLLNGHPELIRDSIRPQYMPEYNYLAPIHPKEEAVEKFFNDMPSSMHLVLNETKVYSGKNPIAERNLKQLICGTFDMLYYDDGSREFQEVSNSSRRFQEPGFVILDYKTNANLYNEYNQKFHKTLLPPFDDIIEEDLGLYTIQLSLYSLMLEDIGIPVIDRRIVWLNNDGQYEIIPVPDVSETLRKCL